jgi:hypothetical protein
MAWARISDISGYSQKSCERIFREERDRTASARLIQERREQLFERFDHLYNWLYEWAYDRTVASGNVPDRTSVDLLLRALNAEAKLLGLPTQDFSELAAVAADRLAKWRSAG